MRVSAPRAGSAGVAALYPAQARALVAAFIAALVGLWAQPVWAQAGAPLVKEAVKESSAPAQAQQWLARIHQAARAGNYQGTLVYSADGMLSSSKIGRAHV